MFWTIYGRQCRVLFDGLQSSSVTVLSVRDILPMEASAAIKNH